MTDDTSEHAFDDRAHRAGVQLDDRFVDRDTIYERGARAATGLADRGVGVDDVVATLMRNDIATYEAAIAAATLGAHTVPINWHFKSDEIRYILEDSGAKVLVAHADLLADTLDAVPSGVHVLVIPTDSDPDSLPTRGDLWSTWLEGHPPWSEPARAPEYSMNYTSGTTGRPKAVRREPLTDDGRIAMARMFDLLHVSDRTRTIVAAPLYHSAPFGFSMAVLSRGGFIALMTRFDPEGLLANVDRHRINNLQMVPTMFVRMLKLPDTVRNRFYLGSLDIVSHAAAPCPPDVKDAMIEWLGPIVCEFYSTSELGLLATFCDSADARSHRGTVGRPVEGTDIAILGDDGGVLPTGQIGEIAVSITGASVLTYHGNDDKRLDIQRGDRVTLGDVGFLDTDGYLYITDRKSDMVISGGANLYPAEVEQVLITMPGVLDCAVFGVPDDDLGEILAAAVQTDPDVELSAADVTSWLTERIARPKVPRMVEFRASLPREDSGKLFKRRLREEFRSSGTR